MKNIIKKIVESLGFGETEEIYRDYCRKHKLEKRFWGGTGRGDKYICDLCDEEARRTQN